MVYTYLNYSDDYNIDAAPSDGGNTPGKKVLSFPDRNHIQGIIRVRGNTKLPQGNQVITVKANVSESQELSIHYEGVISTVLDGTIIGRSFRKTVSEALFIGSKSKKVIESAVIKGKKDYNIILTKFKELGYA